ncbi:MAG: hypothetical protein J6I84_03335 [Bacilli bacterium]|nr:hypothetical protein [Bacilli bacterium]
MKQDNPVQTVLEIIKETVFDSNSKFKPGDIVFDQKNNEYGIVLGKKPSDVYGTHNLEKIIEKSLTNRKVIQYVDGFDDKKDSGTYLLLTMQPSPDDLENTYTFRIRYTNYRFIELIKGPKHEDHTTSITDLDRFCTEQCLMDCSEDCALWKYKRKSPSVGA